MNWISKILRKHPFGVLFWFLGKNDIKTIYYNIGGVHDKAIWMVAEIPFMWIRKKLPRTWIWYITC